MKSIAVFVVAIIKVLCADGYYGAAFTSDGWPYRGVALNILASRGIQPDRILNMSREDYYFGSFSISAIYRVGSKVTCLLHIYFADTVSVKLPVKMGIGKLVVTSLILVLLSEYSEQQYDIKALVLQIGKSRGIEPDRVLNSGMDHMKSGLDRYMVVYRSISSFTCALYVFTDPRVVDYVDVKQVSVNCN
ncbi:hypothetical protein GE061_007382 [Apolygus lucorum]|uniref:Uncharacterized protein n=1 Tax=Apolygus lucorum TaxID=248454 RepID=A0A6A4J5W4_APOLU|nr:hypothetical protein GE061_007382 [Apolygus lucorum]